MPKTFLDFPCEIRNEIYDNYFANAHIAIPLCYQHSLWSPPTAFEAHLEGSDRQASLLLTCHQIYDELKDTFWTRFSALLQEPHNRPHHSPGALTHMVTDIEFLTKLVKHPKLHHLFTHTTVLNVPLTLITALYHILPAQPPESTSTKLPLSSLQTIIFTGTCTIQAPPPNGATPCPQLPPASTKMYTTRSFPTHIDLERELGQDTMYFRMNDTAQRLTTTIQYTAINWHQTCTVEAIPGMAFGDFNVRWTTTDSKGMIHETRPVKLRNPSDRRFQ